MRIVLIILCTLVSGVTIAQENAATLAARLTINCRTEREKLNSIFRWITENISYTILNGPVLTGSKDQEIDSLPLETLDDRVANQVIMRGSAFCDGYARLFKSLCTHVGLKAEWIQGYARNNWKNKPTRFGVNHYWNAVLLDNKWYLLDATWASGYVTWGREQFVRIYDDSYFLSSPESFIQDHYPDDPRWTLLPDNKVPEEFKNSPFRQKAFGKYDIRSFSPGKGIIEANLGDTIELSLITGVEKNRNISADMAADTSIFLYSSSWVFLHPDKESSAGRCQYTYPVDRRDVNWIYLLYNGDLVLRYRINVRSIPESGITRN